MGIFFIKLFLLCGLSYVMQSLTVYAQPSLSLHGDKMTYDTQKRVSTVVGVKKLASLIWTTFEDEKNLLANKITAHFSTDNNQNESVIKGISNAKASGNIIFTYRTFEEDKPYILKAELCTLTGDLLICTKNVNIHYEQNYIQGEKATFNLKKEVITVEGMPKAQNNVGLSKVSARIMPEGIKQ